MLGRSACLHEAGLSCEPEVHIDRDQRSVCCLCSDKDLRQGMIQFDVPAACVQQHAVGLSNDAVPALQ